MIFATTMLLILIGSIGALSASSSSFDSDSDDDNQEHRNSSEDHRDYSYQLGHEVSVGSPNSEDVDVRDTRISEEPELVNPREFWNSEAADQHELNVRSGVAALIDEASGVTRLASYSRDHIEGTSDSDDIYLGDGDSANGYGGFDRYTIGVNNNEHDQRAINEIPQILDFRPGEDEIIISIPSPTGLLSETYPHRPAFSGSVSFESDPQGTTVLVDRVPVCYLYGVFVDYLQGIEVIYDYRGALATDFELQYGYLR